ncbi:DODA-type extradiol aromatic ring-opening family dioxygenase [Klebsiella quasipneumoniae]|nr:hypothetical protein [Klebsiella quasipneumoniae subsp. similipneumoniae]HCA7564494.1 hypothetical protein [Klebsiella quasipneumoniae]
MARILGGIAVSHTPTIGFAVDHHKQQDPAWSPIFQSFEPLQRWLDEKKPDALVYMRRWAVWKVQRLLCGW